jgi:hypothetical protein
MISTPGGGGLAGMATSQSPLRWPATVILERRAHLSGGTNLHSSHQHKDEQYDQYEPQSA